MTDPLRGVDLGAVRALLCDADGNLFPSEEPAFDASCAVTNRFLASIGASRRFGPTQLRLETTGRNFRDTAAALAAAAGRPVATEQLERWVEEERRQVSRHLARTLVPDPEVLAPLMRLQRRFDLAAVSSSALARLDACFAATRLTELFPAQRRFSAEDSLAAPASKPDPAVYHHAGRALGVVGDEAIAIEDSVPGAQSAIAAGFPTIGNIAFVAPAERSARVSALLAAGVSAVVSSWSQLERLLSVEPASPLPAGRPVRSSA